ncbi:unnamed protein product, partial [Rotaria magnacalcarata]
SASQVPHMSSGYGSTSAPGGGTQSNQPTPEELTVQRIVNNCNQSLLSNKPIDFEIKPNNGQQTQY